MQIFREGPVKITKATVDAAWRRRAAQQRLVIGDRECPGLALVVNPRSMNWVFSFKPRGTNPVTGRRFPTHSVTIGAPADISPDDARTAANGHKGQVRAGDDPATGRKAKIAANAERRARTVSRVLSDEYAPTIPKRRKLRGSGMISPKHATEEKAHTLAAVEAMGVASKPIADVVVADIRALLRAEPDHPNAARHRFGAISRFFEWCREEGIIAENPCALIGKERRPKPPASRDHCLTPEELALLWKAAGEADGLAPVHCDLIRLLIAIPCRRGEAASLDWSHLDLTAGLWTQPGRLTKNRDLHRLHLHPRALAVLRERHAAAGAPKTGLVFPAPRSKGVVDSFTAIKAALDKAAGLTGWRIHDFRRSFVTVLAENGVAEPVADAILNHRQSATRGGVLGVYQRAQRWPEQQRAMELWGTILAAAIDGKEAEVNVVPMRA